MPSDQERTGLAVTAWADRYETIRRQALSDSGHGGGLALLLRCGLVTWLRAWSIDASRHDAGATPQPSETAGTPAIPGDLSQEITRILVNMFLDQTQETVP
jgi:hypothetical protein